MNGALNLQEDLAEETSTVDVLTIREGQSVSDDSNPPRSEEAAVEVQAEAVATEEVTAEVSVNIEHLRMTEALLFAASEPLAEEALKAALPEGADVTSCRPLSSFRR